MAIDGRQPAAGGFYTFLMTHSVLIVEDDPYFREMLARAVGTAEDLRLAGTASDLAEGLRLVDALQPDVLLVDLKLPDGDGIALIRHAHERLPQCESMVITIFANDELVVDCIQAGATGYLLKDADDLDVVRHVRQLCNGGSPISPAVARCVLRRLKDVPNAAAPTRATAQRATPQPSLSAQELKVVNLSAKGYKYDEVAELMSLKLGTVETYVKRIYRKLQVHTKTEAVYEARKRGLVDD